MSLEAVDWQELFPVFRETFKIWSPGLSRQDYLEYQKKQADHPWARRHIRHLVLTNGKKIVSSLKFSSVELQVRGETFQIAGIGAVYTQLAERNRGYASKLMKETVKLARKEGYQGLILFSDIDCEFYSRFGFEEIGSADLLIHLPFQKNRILPTNVTEIETGKFSIEADGQRLYVKQELITEAHLDTLTRHYGQWLRTQPYGIRRSSHYFDFKLMREAFLHNNSRLSWPALSLTTISRNSEQDKSCGYVISESAGGVLRILEVAGTEDIREVLWASMLIFALQQKLMRIRAWEGLASDFAPSFNLRQLIKRFGLDVSFPESYKGQLNYYSRTWGKGMILPLEEKLSELHQVAPCPLVELDHL